MSIGLSELIIIIVILVLLVGLPIIIVLAALLLSRKISELQERTDKLEAKHDPASGHSGGTQ